MGDFYVYGMPCVKHGDSYPSTVSGDTFAFLLSTAPGIIHIKVGWLTMS